MDIISIKNSLHDFPFVSCLSESEIENLVKNGEVRVIKRSEAIFKPGDPSKEIFFLLKGVTKITAKTTDHREVIKTILHPGSILSELSLTGEEFRNNEAQVMTNEATVLEVKVDVIKQMMAKNPDLALCIINFIGRKLKYAEERLESLAMSDARERIIHFLKDNANSFGLAIGQETLIKHDFTQQDIASFTGTSRQTVTTVLNDLKKTNKIHFKRKAILIRDLAHLS
jgi:CRP-like cAMP-binding protein